MQHGSQCSCDVNNIKNNPVLAIEMSEQETADGSQENTRYKRLNAASLLIYEKMKTNTYTELLQSSSMRRRMTLQQAQSSGPQENIISFDPLKSQKQERDVQVPLPIKFHSSRGQTHRSDSISTSVGGQLE